MIIKNSDIRYLIKLIYNSKGPFFFINSILNYANSKDKDGARTSYQLKQVFDLLNYCIEQFTNKINQNKAKNENESEDKFTHYLQEAKSFHSIIGVLTGRVKDLLNLSEKQLNEKDSKTLVSGLVNFFSKLVLFMKKHTKFASKSSDDGKTMTKSIEFFLSHAHQLVKKIKDKKQIEEKLLQVQEQI